jgi:hypothetical protein
MSILELFCSVDDFWQQFAPSWHHALLTSGQRQRVRPTQMYQSSIMTILILFQQSHYRTFKAYYTEYVHRHLCSEFPTLVSYQRFVELMPTLLVPRARLSAHAVGQMYRHQLHRLDQAIGLSQRPHPLPSRLRRTTRAARPQSAGSSASSCTWLSTIRAR